ncbi:MAG: tandem-95 repeat protein [Alphaproteobacteria bacterium]|nr:tandem-95 repeat protein [Alphaproteobacteria bacterium]
MGKDFRKSGQSTGRVFAPMLALEPRIMFDGAAMADIVHHAAETSDSVAETHDDVPAPVTVREADPALNQGRKDVAFIDTGVADYQSLVDGVRAGVEVVLIDAGQGGLDQMAQWAETHSGYESIHVLSHGSEGALSLGAESVTAARLAESGIQADLAALGRALTADGDLLIYGCSVGGDDAGRIFLDRMAQLTGADVAASDDLTGAASVGGDWDLEVAEGKVETSALSFLNYQYTLAAPTFTLTTTAGGSALIPGLGLTYHSVDNVAYRDITSGDFDGDGDIDLVGAITTTVYRYTNDGSQNFTKTQILTGLTSVETVVASDIDGDSDIDVLVADGSGNLQLLKNNGSASFTASTIGTNLLPTWIEVADLDSDGRKDIVFTTFEATPKLRWAKQESNGSFTVTEIGTNGARNSVVVTDFDGDGDRDIVSTDEAADKVRLWTNNGSQSFAGSDLATGFDGARSVTLGDIDKDGDMDVVVSSRNDQTIRWLENTGSLNFTTHTINTSVSVPLEQHLYDFDNDGDLDIASLSWSGNKVYYFENDGAGNFARSEFANALTGPRHIKAVDIDGDGDRDVLVTADGSGAGWFETGVTARGVENSSIVFSAAEDRLFSVADSDGGTLTATLSVGAGKGAITVVTGGGATITNDGTISVTIAGTAAQVNAALATVTYTPTTNESGTGYTQLTYSVNDGTTTVTKSVNVDIASLANAPTISIANTSLSYTENGAAIQIDSAATATDPDSGNNWNGGKLEIQITSNGENADRLTIPDNVVGTLNTNGNEIRNNTTVIGSLSASEGTVTGTTKLTITFNASMTDALVQSLVRAIHYDNTSDAPGTGDRIIRFALRDAQGYTVADTRTISVTAVNDAPTLATLPASITVTEDVAGNVDLSAATLGDVDSTGAGFTLKIAAGAGTLAASSSGGVTVSNSGTGTITLTGTRANIDTYLNTAANIQYTGAANSTTATTLTLTANDQDGSGEVAVGTVTVNITAVNDAPTLATLPASVTVTLNVAGNVDLSAATLGDVDSTGAGFTLKIAAGAGTLAASSSGGVTVSNSGTGTITLTGTRANIDTYLNTAANIQYTSPANSPASTQLTLTANDQDGSGEVAVGTVTVNITGGNDAPTMSGLPASITTPQFRGIVNLSAATLSDVNSTGAGFTLKIAAGAGTLAAISRGGVTVSNSGTGTITLTGTVSNIDTYLNTATNITIWESLVTRASTTLTLTANDQDGSGEVAVGTVTVNYTGVNNAPTLTNLPASITVTEGVAGNVDLSAATFADSDSNEVVYFFVEASDGILQASSSSLVTVYASGSQIVALNGTISDIDDYLNTASNIKHISQSEKAEVMSLNLSYDTSFSANGIFDFGSVPINITNVNDAPIFNVFLDDRFSDSNLDGWIGPTAGGGKQAMKSGDLYVIGDLNNQYPVGGMLYNTVIPGIDPVAFEFRYQTGASPLVFFLANGAATTFDLSDHFGGGYGESSNKSSTKDGLEGGWIGLALGGVTSFSLTRNFGDGTNPSIASSYAILRGSDTKTYTYKNVTYEAPLVIVSGALSNYENNELTGFGVYTKGTHRARIIIGGSDANNFTLDIDANDDGVYELLSVINIDLDDYSSKVAARPDTLKFGFTSGAFGLRYFNNVTVDWVKATVRPQQAQAPTVSYTENGAAVTVYDRSLYITDPDGDSIGSATVTISENYQSGADVLAFTNTANITGSWNVATGVLTLTGADSPTNYAAALKTITYVNTSDAPTTGTRTLSYVVTDTNNAAASATTSTVTVTAVNDAPALTTNAGLSLLEDAAATTIGNTLLAVTDADSAAAQLTYTLTIAPTKGTLSLSGNALGVNATFTQDDINNGRLTFAPTANLNGSDSFAYTVSDGTASLSANVFGISITSVNDEPGFTKGADQTVLEDSGRRSVTGWASALGKGMADESGQALAFTTSNNNNALFSEQPTIDVSGNLTFTPTANKSGTATVTVYVSDDGGTANSGDNQSAAQTFTITVTAVNDAPDMTLSGGVVVNEDAFSGADYSQANFVSATVMGPADESGQSAQSYTVTNDNNALFTTQPTIAANGTLTFRTAANGNGQATVTVVLTDDGGTANGGTATSVAKTFTIIVNPANDETTLQANAGLNLNEDAAQATITTAILEARDVDVGTTTAQIVYTVETAVTKGALAKSGNALGLTGTFSQQDINNGLITYTPSANANGGDFFEFTVKDSNDNSVTPKYKFNINLTAVNDVPSFTKGADQTPNEDGGAQTVSGWMTSIGKGAGDETGDTLTIVVSNNNNALFAVQPSIDASGNLTFTPAANRNGTATVSVYLSDNGGTLNGGSDTSATQTFTITVNAVNDAPSFTAGADRTTAEDGGAVTVNGWATEIGLGPSDESGQTPAFVVSNSNNALFAAQPAIGSSGQLTYTPAANASGTATVTVYLTDNGGTANGGANQSASKTFTITVNEINDAPSFTAGANQTVNEDSGAASVSGWASSLNKGSNAESGQTLTFQVSNNNTSLFSTQPAIDSAGNLSYTPAANAFGVATVTVYVRDNGGTANGGADTSVIKTFVITVNSVNDAPEFSGTTAALQSILANAQSDGETVSALVSDKFVDSRDAKDMLDGIAIAGNTTPTTQGNWQYSVDAGETWQNVGTVSTSSALLISKTALVRFLPASGYYGQPGELTVHVVDNSSATTFSSSATRQTFDTTADNATSKVSASGIGLTINVLKPADQAISRPPPPPPRTVEAAPVKIQAPTPAGDSGISLITSVRAPAGEFTQGVQGNFLAVRSVGTTGGSGFQVALATPSINAVRDGALFVAKGVPTVLPESRMVNFSIPVDAFGHTSAEASITLAAKLTDGRPLPTWLSFDTTKGVFVGEAPEGYNGTLSVVVVARDNAGNEVGTTFDIRVRGSSGAIQNNAPPASDSQPPQGEVPQAPGRQGELAPDPSAPVIKVSEFGRGQTFVGKPTFQEELRMASRLSGARQAQMLAAARAVARNA